MGLRATLAAAADAAFEAFDDVPEAATLTVENTTHDPLTASNTKTTTNYNIAKMALVRFKRIEVGSPLEGQRGALASNRTLIEASDMKAIFRTKEIPNVVPKHKDYVTADGTDWTILAVAKDPALVVWILQLRAR